MSIKVRHDLLRKLVKASKGNLLRSRAENQILVRIEEPEPLQKLAQGLKSEGFYLVTMVANDERELEDNCFKIYYIFSDPVQDLFLVAKYILKPEEQIYPSLFAHFPAVDVFEREVRDMFGLIPAGERGASVQPGSWLHTIYPPNLYPLRRDRTTAQLKKLVEEFHRQTLRQDNSLDKLQLDEGKLYLTVGPIHAGIIESGRFVFTIGGEVIEDLRIALGYTHKGIERLFQARTVLTDGWRLAEQVSGDSSFAHSLAYCQAVEALTELIIPEPAQLWRGIFLELERIYNHVGDTAALAQDLALEVVASKLAMIREELLCLNMRLTGNRFLRGLNRPGGIKWQQVSDIDQISSFLKSYVKQFNTLTDILINDYRFRDRVINIGLLTKNDALALGATGMIARASGLERDYRRHHPNGVYQKEWLQQELNNLVDRNPYASFDEADKGDVYARFLIRKQEVNQSVMIIDKILEQWDSGQKLEEKDLLTKIEIDPANNFTFGIGYAEGWRGDIVYFLMQDKLGHIYRCKIRDPSMLNWPAFRQSIIPHSIHPDRGQGTLKETILPDFPLINKSFNLSYSGNDL